jgi:Xaa-Pro dipeptidase
MQVALSEQGFTLAERDRRYQVVRALMRERGIDCIIVPHNTGDWDNFQPDIRYLTCVGGGGMATALVFPLEGDPVVAVRESRRIDWWKASQVWVDDVRSPPKFVWSQFFADVLNEKSVGSSRIGVVGLTHSLRDVEGTISFGEFTALRAALPQATFQCATDILCAARKRKSPEEFAVIERAQFCADRVQAAFRSCSRPGVSEHRIYAEMFHAHIAAGGEVPCMILFSADTRFWQTQVLPTFRTIRAGDVVTIEAEPKYYGYMAQAVDSIAFRPLSELERRLFELSSQSFDFLLSEMTPGKSYADLIRAWEEFVRKSGLAAGRTMGHGLGLGQDGPLTAPSGQAGGLLVEEGDCLVLKPWISDAADTCSARVGGTVVVDRSGGRKLGTSELMPLVMA